MKFAGTQQLIDKIRGKKNISNDYPPPAAHSANTLEKVNIQDKSFYDIYIKHKDLFSTKWEQYLHVYNKHLETFIKENKPVNLLEIGVFKGGSLELWGEYLPENSKITGVDINPKCANYKYNNNNIQVFIGSASDKDFINKNFKNSKFDIIIDDGSHICSDVITGFEEFFPKLNYGGLYIIEDLHTSYWKSHGGGYLKKDSSIQYFKNLIDSLNMDYISTINTNKTKIEEIEKLKILNRQIASMSFYDSILIIEKYYKEKYRPMEICYTGKEILDDGSIKEHTNNSFERLFK